MKLLPCGDNAILLDCGSLEQAQLWHDALADRFDVVQGAQAVLVHGRPPELRRVIANTTPAATHRSAGKLLRVSVRYDGPDLADVAGLTGLDVEDVIAAHTGSEWSVAFAGFAPGFAYLAGGDTRLNVPRRSQPRERVNAGAVGLAGGYSAVYPRASPGGWQIIGHADLALFDAEHDPPALLQPAMRVQFEVAP